MAVIAGDAAPSSAGCPAFAEVAEARHQAANSVTSAITAAASGSTGSRFRSAEARASVRARSMRAHTAAGPVTITGAGPRSGRRSTSSPRGGRACGPAARSTGRRACRRVGAVGADGRPGAAGGRGLTREVPSDGGVELVEPGGDGGDGVVGAAQVGHERGDLVGHLVAAGGDARDQPGGQLGVGVGVDVIAAAGGSRGFGVELVSTRVSLPQLLVIYILLVLLVLRGSGRRAGNGALGQVSRVRSRRLLAESRRGSRRSASRIATTLATTASRIATTLVEGATTRTSSTASWLRCPRTS